MTARAKATELLRREVRFRGIRLGVSVDVLFDAPLARVLGLDVLCGDGARRFLPLAAGELDDESVRVDSALVLSDGSFYRQRGRALSELREQAVREHGEERGRLDDVLLDRDGSVVAFRVRAGDRGGETVPAGPATSVGGESLRAAV